MTFAFDTKMNPGYLPTFRVRPEHQPEWGSDVDDSTILTLREVAASGSVQTVGWIRLEA